MVNRSETGIINRQVAERLFGDGTITLPFKGGDVVIFTHVVKESHFPFHISGGQEQNGQMAEIVRSSGVTQTHALNALPYSFRRTIIDKFLRDDKPE